MNGRKKGEIEYVSIPVERHQELSRAAYWLNRYREAIDQPGEPTRPLWVAKLIRVREMDRVESGSSD